MHKIPAFDFVKIDIVGTSWHGTCSPPPPLNRMLGIFMPIPPIPNGLPAALLQWQLPAGSSQQITGFL